MYCLYILYYAIFICWFHTIKFTFIVCIIFYYIISCYTAVIYINQFFYQSYFVLIYTISINQYIILYQSINISYYINQSIYHTISINQYIILYQSINHPVNLILVLKSTFIHIAISYMYSIAIFRWQSSPQDISIAAPRPIAAIASGLLPPSRRPRWSPWYSQKVSCTLVKK